MAAYTSYVICTSPRSGSTLLCKLLAATGVAGVPQSYFHMPSLAEWMADHDIAQQPAEPERDLLRRIFDAAMTAGRGGTGLFGLRLQRQSFAFFLEKLGVLHPGEANDADRFAAAFGRVLFIHLTRRDKVGQAVSFVKAQQTGLWHAAPDGTELERLSAPRDPVYDAAEIGTWHRRMTEYDRDWDAWFRREGVAPLRLTYEALAEDPQGILRTVLSGLGLDPDRANGVVPGVKRLSDAVSRDWAARFRAAAGAG